MVATITAFNAMSGDVARMQRQVSQMETDVQAMRVAVDDRATQLEQRTAFLNMMLAGHAERRPSSPSNRRRRRRTAIPRAAR